MLHTAKDFSHLLGNLQGFSDAQLNAHFTLYQGYVKKINEIEEKLKGADRSAANYSFNEFSELKRREAVAFNGSYLHQLYFENMNKEKGAPSDELGRLVTDSFGDMDKWVEDVKASGASTPGWVLLTYNEMDKSLHNYVCYEHHIGLPVHQKILMAMDCWEHAFMIDYGIKKADYINAFLGNLDWNVVSKRLAEIK